MMKKSLTEKQNVKYIFFEDTDILRAYSDRQDFAD